MCGRYTEEETVMGQRRQKDTGTLPALEHRRARKVYNRAVLVGASTEEIRMLGVRVTELRSGAVGVWMSGRGGKPAKGPDDPVNEKKSSVKIDGKKVGGGTID